LQREKKEHILTGGHTVPHGSLFAVPEFYVRTNLVKFILKSFVSCNRQFKNFYVRNSTVYMSILKINFSKNRDSQPFGATCLRLVELEHTFIKYCAVCVYVVLLLTSHSAQKFYFLIHIGH